MKFSGWNATIPYMTEIVLRVLDDMPLPGLIVRLIDLLAEEHVKWMLFTKSGRILVYILRIRRLYQVPDGTGMEREKERLRIVIDTSILIGALESGHKLYHSARTETMALYPEVLR